MFRIELTPQALNQLKAVKRYDASQIVHAIETHLRTTPDKPSPPRIKILRGRQQATYRLRAGNYRIFYDVLDEAVRVVAILHKKDTERFYSEEGSQ